MHAMRPATWLAALFLLILATVSPARADTDLSALAVQLLRRRATRGGSAGHVRRPACGRHPFGAAEQPAVRPVRRGRGDPPRRPTRHRRRDRQAGGRRRRTRPCGQNNNVRVAVTGRARHPAPVLRRRQPACRRRGIRLPHSRTSRPARARPCDRRRKGRGGEARHAPGPCRGPARHARHRRRRPGPPPSASSPPAATSKRVRSSPPSRRRPPPSPPQPNRRSPPSTVRRPCGRSRKACSTACRSGSVLLLAAAGLAITFGVMGVINMAHGELVMIGAYTTFVVQEFIRGARARPVRLEPGHRRARSPSWCPAASACWWNG